MPKRAYIGVNNTARKIKKSYIGVEGTARKIKKGYIGIGGVARPFIGSELMYYGTITDLSAARCDLAATSVGDYALFAGGRSSVSKVVDAYNSTLTRSTPTALSTARYRLAGAHVGNYAIFSGGSGALFNNGTVNAYDTTLTRSSPSTNGSMAEWVGTSTLTHAILCPRAQYDGGTVSQGYIGAYSHDLTLYKLSGDHWSYEAGAALEDVAIFECAGYFQSYDYTSGYSHHGKIIRINSDLSVTTLNTGTVTTGLAERICSAAASNGSRVIIAGGQHYYIESQTFHYSAVTANAISVDKDLNLQTAPSLTDAKCWIGATQLGEFAIFAGGGDTNDGYNYKNVKASVDVYDSSMTKTNPGDLSTSRCAMAATQLGNFALFGGGYASANSAIVDVYTI